MQVFSSDLVIWMFFGVHTCDVQTRSDELHLTSLFSSFDQGSANFKADCVNVELEDVKKVRSCLNYSSAMKGIEIPQLLTVFFMSHTYGYPKLRSHSLLTPYMNNFQVNIQGFFFYLCLELFSRKQTSCGLAYISERQKERQKKLLGREQLELWSHLLSTFIKLFSLLKTGGI